MSEPYGTPVSNDSDFENISDIMSLSHSTLASSDSSDLEDPFEDRDVRSERSTPSMYSSSEPEDNEDNEEDNDEEDDDDDNSDNSSEVSMFILSDSDDAREQEIEQQQEQRPAVRDMEGVIRYGDDFNVYLHGTNTRVHFYEEEIVNGDTVPFTGIVYEPA